MTRRDALKQLGTAGTGLALGGRVLRGQGSDFIVAGQPVEIAVSPVSDLTVRLTVQAVSGGSATSLSDGALVREQWAPPVVRHRAHSLGVPLGDLRVWLQPDPVSISIETTARRVIQRLRFDPQSGALSFQLGDRPLLGLGQGGPQFDRRGSVDRMRSGQGGYQLRTHGGRTPIQWLIGTGGWAMFIHQPLGTFDFSGAEGRFDPPPDAPLPLNLFIVGTSNPAAIMKEYAVITGHAEMPPRWSLGYLQSHRTLAGPDEIRWVARTFREKKLPCDALIYLGTGFTKSGWNTYNGEFAWNPANFPEPRKIIDELHSLHYKVVLHIVLEGRRLTGAVSDPCTAPDPGSVRLQPDQIPSAVRWPDDRQVSCYWPVHRTLYDDGIDGWWPDQGDGLDASSRLARNRMYYEGSQQLRPGERPFALHRNGYAGMQRYAAFLWSGDVYSTWETLRTHVPVAINTGLSGIPYWGTDIGGFVPTKDYTGELHVRWFQFGCFCPLFRAHGRTWHLRLPWGWNTGELGPDEIASYTGGAANPDASELRNAAVEPICRKYLELRYRLLPYTYTAVRECCDTGLPIVRALWLHYADDAAAVVRGDEYLWGRDLLVAPVVEKGATSRRLYLPRGEWFDFWSEARVAGGREIDRAVDLETLPLYARAGSILPLGPVKQYTDEPVDGPLSLVIYPGADASFTLYEDDGRTFEYRRGGWMRVEMTWRDRDRRLRVRLAPGSKMLPPARRAMEVRVAGEAAVRSFVFEGREVEIRL
jgi:alpha-glucosidase/alpha-D-xyloside xylohydrolase